MKIGHADSSLDEFNLLLKYARIHTAGQVEVRLIFTWYNVPSIQFKYYLQCESFPYTT
jgi:hypothetical protein